MKSKSFEWDARKYQSNIKKHRVSFDEEHSDSEERYILLGMSEKLRILIVCHCTIEKNKIIRIISARKATKNESRYYKGE